MFRKNAKAEQGFTLIEMIGVLAIISILAAIIAPKIFEAIANSKISSLAEGIATVRTSVTSYYKDTGNFPTQWSDGNSTSQNQMMVKNPTALRGWNGPYLDKALVNPINPNGYLRTQQGSWTFDIDGDGTNDYGTGTSHATVSMVWFNQLSADQAKQLSNIIDSDGDNTTGNNAWYNAGRARTSNSADPGTSTNVTMFVFLGSR